ncbi:MAG: VOC family protein [Bacteroidales bacterium]|nr:VOC family protein [Bacteroidales bacterium]
MNKPFQNITFLKCHDLNITTEFYTSIFELKMVLDQGGCRIFKINNGAFIGFCEKSKDNNINTSDIIITLVTDEVDQWFSKAKKASAKVVKLPAVNEIYQIYHCFLLDPDGYTIEIQKFLHDFG